MTLFGRRVGVLEGDDTERLFEDAEIEGAELDVQREVAGDGGEVPRSDDIDSLVIDVEAPGDALQGRTVVAGSETPGDFDFIGEDGVTVGIRFVEDVGDFVHGVTGEGIERGRNVGLSQQLRHVKFCFIDPLVPDAIGWDVDQPDGSLLCGHGRLAFR